MDKRHKGDGDTKKDKVKVKKEDEEAGGVSAMGALLKKKE